MGPIVGLNEFLSMLSRRAVLVAAIMAAGIVATLAFAMSLPRSYESIAVLQVEPSLLGRSDAAGSSEITGRLRLIEQRVMSRANLAEMIERHDLFEPGDGLSLDEHIAVLRREINIELVPSVAGAPGAETGVSALILRVRAGEAASAAQLANDLAEQILAGNRTRYEQRHHDLVAALQAEDARVNALIDGVQQAQDDYLKAHGEARPENVEILASERVRLQDQQLELTRALQTLERERLALEVGEPTGATTTGTASLAQQLANLELELGQVRRSFGANHPEVKRVQARITALRNGQERSMPAAMRRQIDLISQQEDVLATERDALARRLVEVDKAIATAPEVGARLAEFDRERQRHQIDRNAIAERLAGAQLDQRLIVNEHGERMVLLESAAIPEHPVSSGRRRVAVLGTAASIALALLAAFALELKQPVLRTARQVQHLLGVAPIAIARHRASPDERRQTAMRLGLALLLLAAGAVVSWFIVQPAAG